MYDLYYSIGGLHFWTKYETEIMALNKASFKPFSVMPLPYPDIYHEFRGIDHHSLNMPPLTQAELTIMRQCHFPPADTERIALTVPVKLGSMSREELIKRYLINSGDVFHISLLHSPLVRERMEICLENPEHVYLILHPLNIEIRDYSRHRVDVFYARELEHVFRGNLDNKIRRLFTIFLPDFNAFMLHSSAVVFNKKAALFLAPDGGGKTTIIHLANNGVVLSDDQNILRKESSQFIVHSTPWGKITNGPTQALLGGIFLLEKAGSFDITPIKPREVVQSILENNIPFWSYLPKSRKIMALDIINEICHRIPVYRLRFAKGYLDCDAITASMAN